MRDERFLLRVIVYTEGDDRKFYKITTDRAIDRTEEAETTVTGKRAARQCVRARVRIDAWPIACKLSVR